MLSVAVTVLVTWNFFLYLVVFQVYDTDKDGLISIDDLKRVSTLSSFLSCLAH